MSDESDVGSSRDRRKRKALYIEESSSDSDSSIETTRRKRRKHKVYIRESDSESDSSIEVVHKKRIGRVTSDAEGSTSGSDIVRRKRQVTTLASDSNVSDSSDSEFDSDWVTEPEAKTASTPDTKLVSKNDSSSDSGDDQLEKCPICLLPFKSQEVGSPESCDHSFCIDCILEWSKNVNTCPVDRQIFNLILVRSHYNGKIINQIPIEPVQQQNGINEIQEDPTFCEICGSCEREDRMLLCDGCDLGFHLECLTPPLSDVPVGLWFCPECGPGDEDDVVDVYEVQILLEDAHTLGWPSGPRARNTTRLVPRTRQSERVRARVITHRNQRQRNENEHPQQQARNGSQPGPSSSTDRNRSASSNSRARNRARRPKIRIRYEIDQITGERIAIETKIRRRKKKNRRQRERARMAAQAAKSVKGRLAAQLGICPNNRQGLVETSRAPDSTNSIGYQRSQAGIPALHLFGPREELDYYGGTDSEEDISSANLLIRRRPQASDVALFRRAARRKAIAAPISHQPESTNLLDSILDIQSKFHSKNSVMSLNQDGSVKIDSKDTSTIINNNNNDKSKTKNSSENRRINLNDYTNAYFRQTPMYGNGPPTSPSVYNNADFSRRSAIDSGNTTVTTSSEQVLHGSTSGGRDEDGQNYSLHQVCSSYDYESDKKEKDKDKSRSNTPGTHNSDSELDIYSDIETVSTSRAEEYDPKQPTSPTAVLTPNTPTDDDGNNSDVDLVIDTEKADDSKEQVSSTVDLADPIPAPHPSQAAHASAEAQKRDLEIQNQTVQSTNSKIGNDKDDKDDEEDDSEDGCPNFSIYSSESINIAKTTDLQLISDKNNTPAQNTTDNDLHPQSNDVNVAVGEIDKISILPTTINDNSIYNNEPLEDQIDNTQSFSYSKPGNMQCGLYSDSEDESIVKITKIPIPCEDKAEEEPELLAICEANEKDVVNGTDATVKTKKPFALGDIRNMTEDISEEERSYTPCLDERTHKQGLEGLDTEMISDDDRNDFDESHELKTASEGDALEINAKESELDFSKPEDYEEGEIVDKLKNKKPLAEQKNPPQEPEKEPEKEEIETTENKEAEPTPASFKKLSKSNKERNYRDKEKDKENVRSKSKEKKSDKETKRSKKKEKRKDLERYNVRSMIAEKPRRVRDKFGRDETRKRSPSRSSRSLTPPPRRSYSRGRSYSRERAKKKRRARTKSRSRTPAERHRSRSPRQRRQKSRERSRENESRERANSRDRPRWRNRSRPASASPTRRRREWLGRSKDWSRSLSRSYTPEKRLTPSWTPPRLLEPQPVKPPNLTVILNNDHNKKKKEKRKNKKGKEADKAKKRKRYRTPPPSKEVFASGNNILVSVSFNKDRNQRDVTNKRKRDLLDDSVTRKQRKTKEKRKNDPKRKKKKKDLSGVKPVAIIDLDRSPFREVTPSPEDVIVLTDSENAESNDMLGLQKAICDSSQQVASPERPMNTNYLTGPKTPPEPQVKFTLNPKQTQMRAISNPLHEPDDIEEEIDPQEELEQRLNESLHKGPNTPPEPPNSPPSSPDVYDPFEPTKSRSPTPEPLPPAVQLSSTSQNDSVREESLIDSRNDDDETIDQSHTPPAITDIQPADSQCSNMKPLSPEKSPEQHIGVVINRVVQSQAAIFPTVASKTISSFSNTSLVTSTPMVPPRINILSSTVLTPTTIASALPQRIVLPNSTKSSPVKVSPNKLPIKSTPIKPMPAKNLMNKSNKSSRKSNNHAGNENYDALLDFESPYSPGSSDYEDLFEPPPVEANAPNKNTSNNNKQSASQKPPKDQTAFDILFGTSPVNNCFPKTKTKSKGGNNANKYKKNAKGTKQVGVKIDEDTLKILDELPNSAVEMQVKYKFVDDWVLKVDPTSSCTQEKLQYLKKLNRQERVVEEVKLVLKPHYNKKHINKEEYKDILRRAVPKICHNKSGEINPQKIQNLIEAYVKKIRHSKKVTSSSSVNPQKA